MVATFKSFLADEHGASTVSWVVLTAACMSLALGTIALISGSVEENGIAAGTFMETYEINSDFDTMAANAPVVVAPDPDPSPIN
ncbi:hypothetical protein [Jannaschia sp. CCS1]|uniref:hypothetical protein n=1 Tax=Jannaschia sp. (strain CCS1) TaxID=290400 RepID=UPI000053A8BC|nr:hypothetical protein [Jannaschia sp. CCS1]ABD56526.1 hypothetical protein Jann_3609 [Jannaschia sp. CCS1]